jgi:acetyl esterase/lipase
MSTDQALPPIQRGGPDLMEPIPIAPDHAAVLDIDERRVAGPADAPDVRVLVYRPRDQAVPLPVIISVHGGAFCYLSPDTFAGVDARLAAQLSCLVVAVDYRLAPEHPFPAAIDDCYAVLTWVHDHADELGIDPARIVVVGASAGGALSAALALMSRDRGGPPIVFQALIIPVTDDRLDTPSMRQGFAAPGFSGAAAVAMWRYYLGDDYDRSATSPYAAPARAESVADLPPAYIQTNGLDPLRDEGIAYAQRLLAEGIQVELHNVPNAYHGVPPDDLEGAARVTALLDAALAKAMRAAP